ncbi:MAG: hypothetical protein ACW98A_13590 [Candidatus Hodarchaeales archaeon]
MDERKEEDFNKEFDENGFDPTKDAFFSDLMGMEEEVATEAYELVEHAIQLVNTKYFDDGIEILRQAIGLYTQINRDDEIKAINEKISEVYILKEQAFRESESKIEKETVQVEDLKISEEVIVSNIEPELIQEKIEINLYVQAEELVEEGKGLLETNNFEEALNRYDQAVEILEETNNSEGVERVFKLIEECYNKKAEFLRSVKKAVPSVEEVKKPEQKVLTEGGLKEEKIKKYLNSKKREEEISSHAYELLGKAAELAKNNQYDEALQSYKEGAKLFQDLNWTYEVQKVQDTIIQLEKKKSKFLKSIEEQKVFKEKKIQTQVDSVDVIEQQTRDRLEQEKLDKLEKLKGIELQRMENEFFKAQIDNMATEASRMAREYELAMQKAIKKGEIIEECIYPKVIQSYEKIKELLVDKGWRNESTIYDDTIQVYYQKLEQDKKIRQIEADKVRKQREAEESLKIQPVEIKPVQTEAQLHASEELRRREYEEQKLRTEFEEITNKAERLAREYEVALRKGNFKLKCPYPDIINEYRIAKQKSQERGWETDVAIFSSQILVFTEKLEKDKRLRQIEVEKIQKQKETADILKIQPEEKLAVSEELKKSAREIQAIEEEKEHDFDQLINDMVNKAEVMAREYDLAMKKAVRQGKLANNPPFAEVIKIYERAKQMVLVKERNEEAAAYSRQVDFYTQKWQKDKNLREIEAKKAQRIEEIEEMHRVDRTIEVDKKKLRTIEQTKGEEEDFERYITDNINKAEKLVREFEANMRKAMRKGEIIEDTPYSEVIDIYRNIREKVFARGWKEQAEVYASQIKIYQEKLEKHVNLLEIEFKKTERQKEIEDMHKVGKEISLDNEKLRTIEQTKGEEEAFERYITDNIDNAEKLVREFETNMRKAMRKGEILDTTPYSQVIDIYKEIREKVYARGWKDQAAVYANQIKIYQEKLEKHVNLLEVEAKKEERQKDIDDMLKVGEEIEVDKKSSKSLKKKKEEKEFQNYITELVDKAAKLEREYDSALKKAIKKGEIIDNTPYPEIIEIFKQIKNELTKKGWADQVQIYLNQIKIYEEKFEKSKKLHQVEAKKAKRQKEIEDMHKVSEDIKPAKSKKLKEIPAEINEEDILLDKAMSLIDGAEKSVKNYEISIKTDVLFYESPYEEAIANYQEAKKIFQKIGWNEEASRLVNTIKFYKEKNEKDEKLRLIEKKKLEELTTEREVAKKDTEKALFAREKKILEFEKQKKEQNEAAEMIFNDIHKAERLAKEYELKIKESIFDHEAPYDEILKIYRQAKKRFEQIGWVEESMKIINTIQFYKEKYEKDKKLRALEVAKDKKREEELLEQQLLLKKAKEAQERILKQRKESREEKEEKVIQFESAKNKAFVLMDQAKKELALNNFENAIEFYKKSEEIFTEISWQEGVNMVIDSIAMIKRRQKTFELEQANAEKERKEKIKIEEEFEEKFTKAEELRKQKQAEQKEILRRVQNEKQWEREVSDEAYKLLELGTSLVNRKKFEEAHDKYIEARKLFNKISWKREVSRINNDLLFKLKREKKTYEILEDIKKKKVEEDEQMEQLKRETEKERRELKKQKKEDKRKLAREDFDKKIFMELERAEKFINDFKYNEGILLLVREKKKLQKLSKDEDVLRIDELIDEVKNKVEIPLVTLEPLSHIENLEKYENAYKALDKAQISLKNSQLMKAVSELNEAKFNFTSLKIGKIYNKDIDTRIRELQERLGKKSVKDDFEAKEKEHDADMDVLKARIAARRKQRRKKVFDLLKKD